MLSGPLGLTVRPTHRLLWDRGVQRHQYMHDAAAGYLGVDVLTTAFHGLIPATRCTASASPIVSAHIHGCNGLLCPP